MKYARRNILPGLLQECKRIGPSVGNAVEWMTTAREGGLRTAFDFKFIERLMNIHEDGTCFDGFTMPALWADRVPEFLKNSNECDMDPDVVADCNRFKSPMDDNTIIRGNQVAMYTDASCPCVPFPLIALGWFDADTLVTLPHFCEGQKLPLSKLHQMAPEHDKYERDQEHHLVNAYVIELIISAVDIRGNYAQRKTDLIENMRANGFTEDVREAAQSLANYVDDMTAWAQLTPDFIIRASGGKALPATEEMPDVLNNMLAAFANDGELSLTNLDVMKRYFSQILHSASLIVNPIFTRVANLSRAADAADNLIKWLDETHQLDVPSDGQYAGSNYTPALHLLGMELPEEYRPGSYMGYPYQQTSRDGEVLDPLGFNDDANRIEPWAPNIGTLSPVKAKELVALLDPNRTVPLTDSDKAYAMLRYIKNQVGLFHRPKLDAAAHQALERQTPVIGS